MEIQELRARITRHIDRINTTKSEAVRKRHYVYLIWLIAIYDEFIDHRVDVDISNEYYPNYALDWGVDTELKQNRSLFIARSNSIIETYKQANYGVHADDPEFSTYPEKEMLEILVEFISKLGTRYKNLFEKLTESDRLFFIKKEAIGETIYDYEKKESYVFVPKDRNNLYCLSILIHEFGHAFRNMVIKKYKTPEKVGKYDITAEAFSLFLEIIFCDYLKRINFDKEETRKLEKKFYHDFLYYTKSAKFAITCPYISFDEYEKIVFTDEEKARNFAEKLEEEDRMEYYIDDITRDDVIQYMHGYYIADIYRDHYNENPSFIEEVERHLSDGLLHTSRKALQRMPYIGAATDFSTLARHLKD